MERSPAPFLTAEWRNLVMLNYEIDPGILQPFVPRGTELDDWKGRTFVSVVGFLFAKTCVMGLSIPFHSTFEEVNLRFYVRRMTPDGPRRAVVFIKELVPLAAIAWTARVFYNENYAALPMSHAWDTDADGNLRRVSYEWILRGQRNRLNLVAATVPQEIAVGSGEEFITEHYWGYVRQRDGSTMEYKVEHPRWRVCAAREATLDADVAALYGKNFAGALKKAPDSAFLADGSEVTVFKGVRLTG